MILTCKKVIAIITI